MLFPGIHRFNFPSFFSFWSFLQAFLAKEERNPAIICELFCAGYLFPVKSVLLLKKCY